MKRAQNAQSRFVGAATAGQMDAAIDALREATELAPESGETRLAAAMACSFQGRPEEAREILRDLFDTKPHLAEWMGRMIEAGYIPPDATLLETIAATRPRRPG